jgi:hypothetical protein
VIAMGTPHSQQMNATMANSAIAPNNQAKKKKMNTQSTMIAIPYPNISRAFFMVVP